MWKVMGGSNVSGKRAGIKKYRYHENLESNTRYKKPIYQKHRQNIKKRVTRKSSITISI